MIFVEMSLVEQESDRKATLTRVLFWYTANIEPAQRAHVRVVKSFIGEAPAFKNMET